MTWAAVGACANIEIAHPLLTVAHPSSQQFILSNVCFEFITIHPHRRQPTCLDLPRLAASFAQPSLLSLNFRFFGSQPTCLDLAS